MSQAEINTITSYLEADDIVLEWGAGGSTTFFSYFVKVWFSIEHDIEWVNKIKQFIDSKDIKPNLSLWCIPQNAPRTKPTKREEFKDYVEGVHKLGIPHFDKVLIDGRARLYCAIEVLDYIDKNSIVFVHDYPPRPHYYGIMKYYTLIDKTDTLVVLRKK